MEDDMAWLNDEEEAAVRAFEEWAERHSGQRIGTEVLADAARFMWVAGRNWERRRHAELY